ncbi:MAG: hypothetical protein FWE06_02095 [Oscillospiraceae bacterium]|nr:hypothetical protein [Oscillospiraceae bacterium]
MKLRKISATLLAVLLLAALSVAPATANTPTVVLDLLTGEWTPQHAHGPSTTGGNGGPLTVAPGPNGNAIRALPSPVTLNDFADLSLEVDLTVTGGATAYVVLWLVTEEPGRFDGDSNVGPLSPGNITPILLPAVEGEAPRSGHAFNVGQFNDTIAMDREGEGDTNYYFERNNHTNVRVRGFAVQIVNGATVEVRTLRFVEGAEGTTPPNGATPTPTPGTTATPTPGTTATTPPPAGTGTAAPGQGNPKTSDPGVAMIVMTGLAGLAGAGFLIGKKKEK